MSQEMEIKPGSNRGIIEVIDPVPILDTGRFEGMQRIAALMARSTLMPDCLRMTRVIDEEGFPIKDDRGRNVVENLPYENVLANCFLVVNQSVRWGLDPFAVAQCVSVVGGRLCYEGKLVAGVLDAKLGVELDYKWNDEKGDAFGIVVSGRLGKRAEVRTIQGTVGEWKTTRRGSPWLIPANHRRMLAYRGAREWARIHKPSIMLGVYTTDEMEALEQRPRSIAPVQHALGKPQTKDIGIEVLEQWAKNDAAVRDGQVVDAPQTSEARAEHPPHERPTDERFPASSAGRPSDEPVNLDNAEATDFVAPGESAADPTKSDGSMTTRFAAPAGGLPEPTDDVSYIAHVEAWAGQVSDRKAALAKWREERALRTRLNVDMETVERCKAHIEATWP